MHNSLPGAALSLYIDFDGSPAFDWLGAIPARRVHGPGGNDGPVPAFSLDSNVNDFTADELVAIDQLWSDVAEKYSPFNINVTTVVPPNFNDGEAIQMIVGGDQLWYTLDPDVVGASVFGGFTDNTRSNQGFAFSANIIDAGSVTLSDADRDLLAETIAHEAGHIFGLEHQSVVDGDNNVIEEYSNGNALGVPIMGNSGTPENAIKHGIWFDGASSYQAGGVPVYGGQQDDLDHLYNLLGQRPDDFGPASSWTTNDNQGHFTAKGIIGNLVDTDGFRFTATGTYGYFAMSNQGPAAMLTPRMELRSFPTNTPIGALETLTTDNFFRMDFNNLVIGQQYIVVASSDFTYGSLGQYDIFASNFNNFAYVQNGVLYINGFDTNDDDIQLDLYYFDEFYYYVDNVVNGNVISLLIPSSQVNSIVINTGAGHDSVRYLSTIGSAISTVDLGSGLDILEVRGSNSANFFDINANSVNFSYTQVNFNSSVELLSCMGLGGDDTFTVFSTGATGVLMYGGENNDTATYVSQVLGSSPGGGAVFFGDNGSDTMILGSVSSAAHAYTVSSSEFYGGAVFTSIGGSGRTFDHTGVETIRLGGSSVADQFNINYVPAGQAVIATGNNGNDTFVIGKSLSGSVTANGNDGNDSFIVGGGNVGTAYTVGILSGGAGNDSLVLDDSLYAGAADWAITDTNIQRNIPGLAQIFSYAGFEGVGIKTGTGGSGTNNITTFGAIPVSVTVTGGAGRDHFFINNFANEAAGGPAGPEQLQSMFDGGGGFNQLIVDDSARGILTYNMYPTRLEINEVLADDGEFSFLGIQAMSVTASNSLTTFNLYGTPTTIDSGNQTTVFLRGGNDVANVFPHDAAGNLTITTNVGIVGEGGTDTLNIQDAASAAAINYLFSNPFGAGTQSIYGLGGGGLGTATVENQVVNAGTGADTFDVNQFTSGVGLSINAGGGIDTLNFGNGNLSANITNIASFNFDGQGGYDTFNLNNQTHSGAWTYSRTFGSIGASSTLGAFYFLTDANTELMRLNGGPSGETFNINAVAAGSGVEANGAGGTDILRLGASNNVQFIQGPVSYDAGADGGSVIVSASAHSDAKTVHFTASTLGAHPDDNLFGGGGSLEFFNITAMTLTLGTGADTVYAQPNATATVSVEGNNPTSAPGDTLNLNLSTAENYVINGSSTSGNVTSSNLMTLSYNGFETGPNIDDVPDVPIFVVDTLVDESDGDYSAGDLSLREAIRFSNFTSEIDSIAFSAALSGGTIVLMLGELRITRSVPIIGLGADLLTIDASGNDTTPLDNEGNGSRVFNIDDGNVFANIVVEIVGLTLTGGDVTGSGGGILTREVLSITASSISGNAATTGGGFHSLGGNLTVTSSTISGNSAINGGGIYSQSSSLMVTNSTISGNAANSSGGGILILYGGVLLAHSTITGNVADADVSNSGLGGGIAVFDNPYYPSVNVELDHVIVAGNLRGASTRSDIFGLIINGTRFSLIGDRTGVSNIINNGGNLIGTSSSPIDPVLGPLADNGGPTMTHALLPGSPAADAGDSAILFNASEFDQRGAPFVRVFDGDSAGGAQIDIGAFELQPLQPELPGDYNRDAAVDAADYVLWRKMLGNDVVKYSGADGSGNANVGPEDHDVWVANFGETLSPPEEGAGSGVDALAAGTGDDHGHSSLPSDTTMVKAGASGIGTSVALSTAKVAPPANVLHAIRPVRDNLNGRTYTLRPATRRGLTVESRMFDNRHDAALVAWLSRAWDRAALELDVEADGMTEKAEAGDSFFESFDEAFAGIEDAPGCGELLLAARRD